MAKRRSRSVPSSTDKPRQTRRPTNKSAIAKQKKPSGSATGTESLREEAERGWAKSERLTVRRKQRAKVKILQGKRDRVKD